MATFVRPLTAFSSFSDSVTIDLGFRRRFLAWTTVTMIDSLTDFDRDNAIGADIFTVDGVRQPIRAFDGDHWGPEGSGVNLRPGAVDGFGRRVEFWLRGFHVEDLAAYGEAIVLTTDD